MSDETFLSRWSRRKTATAKGIEGRPRENTSAQVLKPGDTAPVAAALPPIESLTSESDFAPFLRNGVEEALKRRALKTLFQDPRFNVMDGLDVYIDDFSKPDPLPEGWLEQLNQVARLGEYREPEPAAEPESEVTEGEIVPPVEQQLAANPSDTSTPAGPNAEVEES
jgi:hypothetical protein